MQRRITEKYALPRERLVDGLGTRKRVMTQDDLYSRFLEHVETIYLAIYHQTKLRMDVHNKPDTLAPHGGSTLWSG
jgi:hypothetical protein